MSKVKTDRRYKAYLGQYFSTLKEMVIISVFGIGAILIAQHFLLNLFGIGGFFDHLSYWMY